MSHYSLWRWEQDGAGGEHGTATFFLGTPWETSTIIPTFKEAFALGQAIEAQLKQARWDARRGLLNEIGRIEP